MKAIKYIVLAIFALHFLQTNALTFKSGGLWFKATSETTARLVASKDDPYEGDIVIPETVSYEGLTMTVNAIGQRAFSYDSLMTSVFIPKTIESIRDFSFEACYSLERITVDSDNSFFTSVNGVLYDKDQISLKVCPGAWEGEFVIPNGVNYVEFAAFFSCKKVTSIYIPESVEYITMEGIPYPDPDEDGGGGELAFSVGASTFNYPALQGFVIDEKNPVYAFENNCLIDKSSNYILKVLGQVPDHFIFPDGIEGINGSACRRKFNLREVTFPKSLKYVGDHVFESCPVEKVNIPIDSQLETVEYMAFDCTVEMDSLFLPSSIRKIGEYAFITKVVKIAEGLTSMNFHSFPNVQKMYLPSTISEINGYPSVFLEHIEIAPGGFYYTENDVVYSSDMKTLYLCAPKGGVSNSFSIPSSVVSIKPYAFYCNSTISELTIPGSVKEIPEYMFFNAAELYSNLQKLVLEEGVEKVSSMAFYGNHTLNEVHFPFTLKEIEGDWTFFGCNNVIEVYDYTPDQLSSYVFPNVAFRHLKEEPSCVRSTPEGLLYGRIPEYDNQIVLVGYAGESEDVIIPEKIEGEDFLYFRNLFQSCPTIRHLTLPNNKSIFDWGLGDSRAFFYNNNSLQKITIPAGATLEGNPTNVFRNLKAEIELAQENGNMTYEGQVLYNKDKSMLIAYNNFTDSVFVMPETVTDICEGAFAPVDNMRLYNKYSNLKKVVVGENVKRISYNTFYLDRIHEMVIPNGIELDFGSVFLCSGNEDRQVTIELGAGLYCVDAIEWMGVEQINSFEHSPDDAIIKCNFTEPLTVQCPFRLDVDYWGDVTHQATLHVPYGSKEKFATAPGWSLFDHIVETFEYIAKKYAVTYMVDGNVYRQDSVFENTEIVLPDVPQRDGYKFSGWSEVPSTMGYRDIIVEGHFYKLGDVNDDSKVNIIDINSTVDMIFYQYNYDLSTYEGGEKAIISADVNEDTFVDIADVYGIANFIMEGSFSPAQNARPRNVGSVNDSEPRLMIIPESEPSGNGLYLSIVLDDPCLDIVAMQFDLSLPDGILLAEEDAIRPMNDTSHSLKWNTTAERGVRFVNYSIANSVIKEEDATVVKVKVRTECDLSVDSSVSLNHVVLVSSSGQITRADYTCPLFSTDETSGIEEIHKESYGSENTIYDVTGQRHILPQKGLNIVGGKIFLVK